MTPAERLTEIENKLSRNHGGMRYCASGEETEWLVARIKKLTEILEEIYAEEGLLPSQIKSLEDQ